MRVAIAMLLHQLPNGTRHVDLLVAPTEVEVADEERTVCTWRVPERPDRLKPGARLAAEPIDAHRGLYLRLTSPRELSDRRGLVTPLRRGRTVRVERREDVLLAIEWDDGGRSAWQIVRSEPCELVVLTTPESTSSTSEQ